MSNSIFGLKAEGFLAALALRNAYDSTLKNGRELWYGITHRESGTNVGGGEPSQPSQPATEAPQTQPQGQSQAQPKKTTGASKPREPPGEALMRYTGICVHQVKGSVNDVASGYRKYVAPEFRSTRSENPPYSALRGDNTHSGYSRYDEIGESKPPAAKKSGTS